MQATEGEWRPFWRLLIWAALLGTLGSIGILLFILAVNVAKGMLWPEINYDPFSMPWWIVPLFTLAGLLVGLIYRFAQFGDESIFESLAKGRIEYTKLPWQLLNSFITLVGGFSLGPEAPAGLVAGGTSSWITDRRKFRESDAQDVFTASVSGSFGGLFSSPFVGVLIALELSNPSKRDFTRALALDTIAAVSGFAVFYSLVGMNPEIGFIVLPTYEFETWHILLGAFFGLVGALLAIGFGTLMGLMRRILGPLQKRPLIRCTMVGLLLGLLAFAMPLCLFLGLDQLSHVIEYASSIGIVMLLLAVVARMVATTGALASGFMGGPIFPTIFMGGTMGAVFTLLFPDIPIALSAGALSAAMPAGILPIPLSISIFAMIIMGLSPTEVVPVLTAGVVSFVIVQSIKSRRARHHRTGGGASVPK